MNAIKDSIKTILPPRLKIALQRAQYFASDKRALQAAVSWPKPLGFDRIYCYHIRKTAGTSLALAFMNLDGPGAEEARKADITDGWVVHGGRTYVFHNKYLLEQGNYFYGFSHAAMHELKTPDNSLRITLLRDPAARLISYYRMLMRWERNDIPHPARAAEGKYLGSSFSEFLDRVPRQHFLRQLYVFSRNFDVDEALENLSKVNFIISTERYNEHLRALAAVTELNLPGIVENRGDDTITVSAEDRARVRDHLAAEYAMIDAVAPYCGIFRPSS